MERQVVTRGCLSLSEWLFPATSNEYPIRVNVLKHTDLYKVLENALARVDDFAGTKSYRTWELSGYMR